MFYVIEIISNVLVFQATKRPQELVPSLPHLELHQLCLQDVLEDTNTTGRLA